MLLQHMDQVLVSLRYAWEPEHDQGGSRSLLEENSTDVIGAQKCYHR